MMKKVAKPIYIPLGQNFLAVTFLFAACAKWIQLGDFVGTLTASGLVPLSLAPLLAMLIVVLELFAGIGLLIRSLRVQALTILLVLLPLFLFYSIWRQVQHIEVPCNCFGAIFKISPMQSILFNIGLLGLTVLLLKSQRHIPIDGKPDQGNSEPTLADTIPESQKM